MCDRKINSATACRFGGYIIVQVEIDFFFLYFGDYFSWGKVENAFLLCGTRICVAFVWRYPNCSNFFDGHRVTRDAWQGDVGCCYSP